MPAPVKIASRKRTSVTSAYSTTGAHAGIRSVAGVVVVAFLAVVLFVALTSVSRPAVSGRSRDAVRRGVCHSRSRRHARAHAPPVLAGHRPAVARPAGRRATP